MNIELETLTTSMPDYGSPQSGRVSVVIRATAHDGKVVDIQMRYGHTNLRDNEG